jgi:hypothetical protein
MPGVYLRVNSLNNINIVFVPSPVIRRGRRGAIYHSKSETDLIQYELKEFINTSLKHDE